MKRSKQNLGGDYGLLGVARGAGFKLTEAEAGAALCPPLGTASPRLCRERRKCSTRAIEGIREHMPLRVIKEVAFLPASSILLALLAFTRYLPRLPPLINMN